MGTSNSKSHEVSSESEDSDDFKTGSTRAQELQPNYRKSSFKRKIRKNNSSLPVQHQSRKSGGSVVSQQRSLPTDIYVSDNIQLRRKPLNSNDFIVQELRLRNFKPTILKKASFDAGTSQNEFGATEVRGNVGKGGEMTKGQRKQLTAASRQLSSNSSGVSSCCDSTCSCHSSSSSRLTH